MLITITTQRPQSLPELCFCTSCGCVEAFVARIFVPRIHRLWPAQMGFCLLSNICWDKLGFWSSRPKQHFSLIAAYQCTASCPQLCRIHSRDTINTPLLSCLNVNRNTLCNCDAYLNRRFTSFHLRLFKDKEVNYGALYSTTECAV